MSTTTEHSNSQIVHSHSYPDFANLDLIRYARVDGMQTLGFVQTHRPDIHIVTDLTESAFAPDVIIPEIEAALAIGKKVALFFWDEDLIIPNHNTERLLKDLERFSQEPVYLCSNMDGECLLTYTETLGWPIKVMHMPWWYLNTITNYLLFLSSNCLPGNKGLQFACFANRPDWHKEMLKNCLLAKGLGNVGDIRYHNQQFGSALGRPVFYYQDQDRTGWKSSHDMKRSLVYDHRHRAWICHLSRNMPRIQHMLGDIPLVIQPESNLGIFPMTEKSLWPIMMDRLVLIQARPRFMSWFQEYVGYDFSRYTDLEFDCMDGWTPQQQQERTECMIDNNRLLIENAREIWHVHRQDLHRVSQLLPQKIYQRFCAALDLIQ